LDHGVRLDGSSITLVEAGQVIDFVDRSELVGEGIVRCGLELNLGDERPATLSTEIGGVLFTVSPPSSTTTLTRSEETT